MTEKTPIARLRATGPRRVIAVSMLFALGGLLLYLALTSPPVSAGWLVFLLIVGAGAIYLGERMRRATAEALELTEDGLVDTAGRTLCRCDEIVGIDRGIFAFKPSNGFMLKLDRPGAFHWSPGLWWRIGRRVGIGGVTPGAQGKFMAEMIAQMLARRG